MEYKVPPICLIVFWRLIRICLVDTCCCDAECAEGARRGISQDPSCSQKVVHTPSVMQLYIVLFHNTDRLMDRCIRVPMTVEVKQYLGPPKNWIFVQ